MSDARLPDAPSTSDLVARLRASLEGRRDVMVAVLFGSAARGEMAHASDVDLAVLAPGVDLLTLSAHVARGLDRDVDVVSLVAPPVPLLDEMVRDGIVVHEGAPGAGAAWRSSALAMLETDRPWYARMRDAWLRRVAGRGILDGQR